MASEARTRANVKWTKNNVKTITFGLRFDSDSDIIDFLATKENRQQYLKDLIRADMKR